MENNKVEFNEVRTPKKYTEIQPPKIVQWAIKYSGGLIKNEKQASVILIGISILLIGVSVFWASNSKNKNKQQGSAQPENQVERALYVPY